MCVGMGAGCRGQIGCREGCCQRCLRQNVGGDGDRKSARVGRLVVIIIKNLYLILIIIATIN